MPRNSTFPDIKSLDLPDGLLPKLTEAANDDTLAGIFLSGEGKCFSAGASVEEHKKEHADDMIGSFVEVCEILNELPVPTVALVHGCHVL